MSATAVLVLFLAIPAEGAQIFDFRQVTEIPAGWESSGGTWQVRDGKLSAELESPRAETTLILGDAVHKDVVVEIEAEFTSVDDPSRWLGILVRDGGKSRPGVQFTIRQDASRGNGLEVGSKRAEPGGGWRVLQTARGPADLKLGEPHQLRVEAVGRWICGYLDGQRVIRSCRGDEFAAGRVGLRVGGARVGISRISITGPEAAEEQPAMNFRTRPLVIAHRGFSWIAPENTLVSYRLAIQAGAEMAECDVYLTSDRVPILLHDRTLARTTGRKARPGELTLAQIKELDAGSWKSPEFAGERIPTLQEALELARGRLRLVIEIKEESIAPAVLQALQTTGIEPQDVMIFSFYDRAVREIARLEPKLPTTWLIDEPGTDPAAWRVALGKALEIRASAVGVALPHVDPGFVRLAHECGLSVFVWTVNEPADMSYLVRLGVDAIISDRPDVVLSLLGAPAAR